MNGNNYFTNPSYRQPEPRNPLTRGEIKLAYWSLLCNHPRRRDGILYADCPFCARDFLRGELTPRRFGIRLLASESIPVESERTLAANLSTGFASCSHCRRSWRDPVDFHRDLFSCPSRLDAERQMIAQEMIHPPEAHR